MKSQQAPCPDPDAGVAPHAVPPPLRSWLFDYRSLSRRLARACPGGFAVQLVGQHWQPPLPAEREALGLARGELALVREVLLLCHGTPWVFGRTVFPRHLLRGSQRRLLQLGTRPLGEMLFNTPGMRRERVQVTAAGRDPRTLQRCARALGRRPSAAWKRASVFRAGDCALLVNEIFLEEFARD
jgi:chorismate--pyruvate lyase